MNEQMQMFHPSNGLGGYKEQIKAFPMASRRHPATSHAAARKAKPRANSMRIRILSLYRSHVDMTSEEVGHALGSIGKPGACYWQRVSELNKTGMVEPTGELRAGMSGSEQRVFRITTAGRELLKELGL
jgi:hypothetical protein